MSNKFKTIGILGGIGPSASASMYSRIIRHMQENYGAWDDSDFPSVMVYSTSLKGFDENGISDEALVVDDLVKAVLKLEEMGSELIVVACNTVHYFDQQMEDKLGIPIVHMISESCLDVKKSGYKKVGIACSQSTRDLKLYSDGLKKLGIEPIISSVKEQIMINNAIKSVMSGKQNLDTIQQLNVVFDRYKSSGAEAVILGCTELPLAIDQSNTDLPLIDANDVVVSQAVNISMSK